VRFTQQPAESASACDGCVWLVSAVELPGLSNPGPFWLWVGLVVQFVRVEPTRRDRGGKTVTVITGIEGKLVHRHGRISKGGRKSRLEAQTARAHFLEDHTIHADTEWRVPAGAAEERTALMKSLKTQCGAGGKVSGDAVEIQGDHAAKIVQLLVQAGYTNTKKSGGK